MTPQIQLRKGTNGSCLQACVAALLEVKQEKVPDFVMAPEYEDSDYPGWWNSLHGFLGAMGLTFLEIQLPPNMPFMPLPFPTLCIFFGETTNGIKHCVIGRIEGDQFIQVHNPWPEAEFANGVSALGFIVPRDPSMPVNMGRSLEKITKLSEGYSFDTMTSIGIKMNQIHEVSGEVLGRNQATIDNLLS